MKILSITEKVPQPVTLEDGLYSGMWGGHVITVTHKGRVYDLETEEGVRGINFKVIVTVKDGEATFRSLSN